MLRLALILAVVLMDVRLTHSQAEAWVDSVYAQMKEDERIGQLFMIRAHSNLGADHVEAVKSAINKYQVGGLCFFQGTPLKEAELTNVYQAMSKVPLMVGIDAEWGLGMRFKDHSISYPRQLMLGAIQDNYLIYEFGKEVAFQLKRIGVNINFAPVVDINNNANNPVINDRSFGEDRTNVSVKGYMYMRGLQDAGVMASAKHFPGHGDTDVDSHLDLPIIGHPKTRLDSLELYPFRSLTQQGIKSVMIAHLNVPAIEPRKTVPSSLSSNIIDVLRKEMNFQGLVFTDALEMKGVTKNYQVGQVEVEALLAGNDMLLLPQNLDESVRAIKKSLQTGKLTWDLLQQRIKKILYHKYEMGLTATPVITLTGLQEDIQRPQAIALKQKLIEQAVTLVRNDHRLLPIVKLDSLKLHSLVLGAKTTNNLQTRMADYTQVKNYTLGYDLSEAQRSNLLQSFSSKDLVIVSLHALGRFSKDQYGLPATITPFIEQLSAKTNVILIVFGNPYSLKFFEKTPQVICAYEDDPLVQDVVAQMLFGAIPFQGRLPVSPSTTLLFNTGYRTSSLGRLGYGPPERVGMSSQQLLKIDQVVGELLARRATPGCQILVAKDRKIIYEAAFGHHTYDKTEPVLISDLYDVASVTKVASTTLAIMDLVGKGQLNITQTLGDYFPDLKGTNKGPITIKEILAHHGRLIGWIPFYRETLVGTKRKIHPSPKFYQSIASQMFPTPVAKNLYLQKAYEDTIWTRIAKSDLRTNSNYRYSDLGFYYLAQLVRKISGLPLDEYCHRNFYEPLGLQRIAFNPHKKFLLKYIVPSENDNYFRFQRVQGYVHDMGAAMLGGVSGHAGLFSNAHDLAVLMQMALNEGQYGGKQFLQPEVIESFATRYMTSTRRGLGFDMKELNANNNQNTSPLTSDKTFGHTGFTGTAVWADPSFNLVYVFLSNRTYPSSSNNTLNKNNYREKIQDIIYQSILN